MNSAGILQSFLIDVDGEAVAAQAGQTVAAALTAAGRRTLRHTAGGSPRGVFCGMGVCFECLVTIDELPNQRACMTLAQAGMRVHLDLGSKDPVHGND
jgi:predicted molibdopterin-dependent oxidoreductase YjgC